jgi:hypothetical protein
MKNGILFFWGIYTENKSSADYAQGWGGTQKTQLYLPVSL